MRVLRVLDFLLHVLTGTAKIGRTGCCGEAEGNKSLCAGFTSGISPGPPGDSHATLGCFIMLICLYCILQVVNAVNAQAEHYGRAWELHVRSSNLFWWGKCNYYQSISGILVPSQSIMSGFFFCFTDCACTCLDRLHCILASRNNPR